MEYNNKLSFLEKLSGISKILLQGVQAALVKPFRKNCKLNEVKGIVIYSRDELKQWELQQKYPASKFPQIRIFLAM